MEIVFCFNGSLMSAFISTVTVIISAAVKSKLARWCREIPIDMANPAMTHDDFHTNRSIGTSDETDWTKKHGGTSKLARTSYATNLSFFSLENLFLVYIARVVKYFPLLIAWERLGTLCSLVRPQNYLYVYVPKM